MTTREIRTRKRRGVAAESRDAVVTTPLSNSFHNPLDYAVAKVDPEALKPAERILRRHSDRKLAKLGASIRQFGMRMPILAQRDGRIVCGHARWLAARDIGMDTVPVIYTDDLGPEDARLYAIADNRSGEEAEWILQELKLEFIDLRALDLDLKLPDSFFETSEIDAIIELPDRPEKDGEVIGLPQKPVTCPGDLWVLSKHRLLCGDALKETSYEVLLGDERAQMIFSDPPYNLSSRTITGMGKAKHGDFAMASGEMSRAGFTEFLTTAFILQARYSVEGSVHFQCMDWRHLREMLDAGEVAYTELKNLIVFDKGSGGMGTFYRSQHEMIFAWKHGTGRHINNFGLGKTGRYRTNLWSYRSNNSFHRDRDKELSAHCTVKPRPLVADAIRDCSHIGGIILDVFGGAGTTLCAAQLTNRQARLIEIAPGYCDATVRRWQDMTGEEAVLAATGQTFAEVAIGRGIAIDDETSSWSGLDEEEDA